MTVDLFLGPTDEQTMLVEASVRFMDRQHPMTAVRARADGSEHDDDAYRRVAAELGWFGFLAPADHGGGGVSGNGLTDAAVIAAERGARLQPGPYPGHSAVILALSTAGAAIPVLGDLVAGRGGWATWTGEQPGTCTVSDAAGRLRLDGHVEVVAEGPSCRWFLVTADGPHGVTQVLVDRTAAGVELRQLEALDVSRRWSSLTFDNVPIDAAEVIGTPGPSSEALVARQRLVATTLTAAEAVGAMDADHAMAVQYAKDRIAFGRPIGSFQAIKHLLADDSLWLEMSKGIVAAAAEAVGGDADDGPQLAHAAMAFVADHGVELAHDSFQVFGGIGYTWEHDQHLYLRRITADAAGFGSAPFHRARLLEAAGVDR